MGNSKSDSLRSESPKPRGTQPENLSDHPPGDEERPVSPAAERHALQGRVRSLTEEREQLRRERDRLRHKLEARADESETQAQTLLRLADSADLFRSPKNEAFATFETRGPARRAASGRDASASGFASGSSESRASRQARRPSKTQSIRSWLKRSWKETFVGRTSVSEETPARDRFASISALRSGLRRG